jgi:hypothetical protein
LRASTLEPKIAAAARNADSLQRLDTRWVGATLSRLERGLARPVSSRFVMRSSDARPVLKLPTYSGGAQWSPHRGCQPAALAAVRETGLMWANMLRAFQVGKALTSDGEPSSWMRPSRVA